MSILNDIKSIKNISVNSTSGIISISNENFRKISESLYKFLTYIDYNETNNSMSVSKITTTVLSVNSKIEMILNGSDMFKVDSNGRLYARNIISDSVIESKISRLRRYDNFPAIGNSGEIVYGKQNVNGSLDFWGYIQDIGWLSLTGNGGGTGSPIQPGSDIVWNGSILDIVTSPPDSPTRYGKYLIDWVTPATGLFSGYEGQIAIYDFNNLTWSFKMPDDGSYIVNESNGGKIYIATVSGINISWTVATGNVTIGPDEMVMILNIQMVDMKI